MKVLDINGVSTLWRRIKETFARKDETVKSISRDDTTFTVTRADGTTFEFTQKDTTYGVATESADGLMSSDDKAKLNALADSDDTTLDQLSEIVAYIKNNKDLIDGITTGKVSVADIVDNLTSTAADKPLSANQGRILKEMLEEVTGVEYHVCTEQEYDATTLVPTLAGDAGVIYLVPIPPDTGKTTAGDAVVGQAAAGVTTYYDLYNGYTEWIYNDDKFERIGEQTATNNDIKKMLKSLGLIDDIAVIDEAVIDESVVG